MMFFLLAFVLSTLFVYAYLVMARASSIFDHANERSMHRNIKPRGAGIAFVLVAVLVALWWWTYRDLPVLTVLLAAMLVLLVLGAFDDIRRGPDVDGVPAMVRIVGHFACACAITLAYIDGNWFWQLLCVFAIVWWINLTNFMDGIDGIAAGFSIIVHAFLALWAWQDGSQGWFIFNTVMVATLMGYLVFNWPPARIFMGDSGSTVLGLTLGSAGLASSAGVGDIWPFALVSLPFWLDATLTLVRRIIAGEPFWQAHRSHFYQRMVVHESNPNGRPVAFVTLLYMGMSFIFGIIASMIRLV